MKQTGTGAAGQIVYRGVELTKDENDVLKMLHNQGGTRLQIHYEKEHEQFVVASYISGIRVWPIPNEVVDGLLNKRFISHNPAQFERGDGWYWLV